MLAAVKVPVLFTHHYRHIDEATGRLQGALSDLQARHARELITAAGQRLDYRSLPDAGHNMNQADPHTYAVVLRDWAATLND
jgi:hypothetical protein